MTRHALIIGIAEYASFSRLEKATGDAEAVAQILEKYGNFDTIQHLPEGWNEAKGYYIAPEKLIGNVLGEALRTFLFERAVGQEAFIYFTGHGFKTVDILGQENGYLATSDCLLETNAGKITGQRNGVSLDSLNQLLVDARLSSLLVLLDCCHSGYLIEERLMNEKLSVFNKTRNACLIASSQSFEVSYVGREHSIFTGALLSALSSDSAARDGTINSLNLIDKIESQLRRSGQQPIYMGYGNSIAVVSYEPKRAVESEVRVNRDNPYVGLDAFNREKSSYFFGREKAIQDLQMRLRQGRFLCIIGASGAGKSSLVKAGLLPTLEKQYTLDSLTPGYNPPQVLIDRLTSLHSQNRPFILFIDQFEEVFTLCKDDELRKSFFHLVAEVVKNLERQGQVIMAIRGDFLDRCAEYPEIAALANETQPTTYMVEPLTTEELYRAIAEPAKLHGVSFQGGLVERMVREVAAQPGALPLLQYALRELWRVGIEEVTSETAVLTWEEYNQIGGVGGALDKKADLIYSSFPEERERDLLRRLCLELVELGEGDTVTRRRVTRESLAAEADSPEHEQFERVLNSLVQSRLVAMTLHKISGEHYESYVEVTHEALLSNWGMLRDWIAENRDNLRRKRRFEGYFATWCNAGKSEEALLSGLWLSDAEALQGQKGVRLSAEEKEFIEESVRRRDREVQAKIDNARIFAGSATIVAFLVGILGLSQILAKTREAELARLGQVEALTATAEAYFSEHKQLEAVTASVKALTILDRKKLEDKQLLQRLTTIVDGVQERSRFKGHNNSVVGVSISKDDKQIVSSSLDGALIIWDISGKPLRKVYYTGKFNNAKFSHDRRWLAITTWDGSLLLLDLKLNNNYVSEEKHFGYNYDVSFDINNQFFASSGIDGTIRVWSLQNKKLKQKNILDVRKFGSDIQGYSKNKYRIKSLDFNPKKPEYIAYGGDLDGSVKIWNWRSNEAPKVLGRHQDIKEREPSFITGVKYSPNGKIIASSDSSGYIELRDADTSRVLAIIKGDPNYVYSLAFSHKGDLLASSGNDGKIKLWNLDKIFSQYKSVSGDKKIISDDESIVLYGHEADVNRIEFTHNDRYIVSGSDDKTVRVWEWQNFRKHQAGDTARELLSFSCPLWNDYFTNSVIIQQDPKLFCDY